MENASPNARVPASSAKPPPSIAASVAGGASVPTPQRGYSPGGTAFTAYEGYAGAGAGAPPAPPTRLATPRAVLSPAFASATPARGGGAREADAPTLRDHLLGSVQPLLDTVHRLHAAGVEELGISLPRIVVVGEQSSGKSSVLEALIGYDILPTGSGIVTRRPLWLRLVSTASEHAPGTRAFAADCDDDALSVDSERSGDEAEAGEEEGAPRPPRRGAATSRPSTAGPSRSSSSLASSAAGQPEPEPRARIGESAGAMHPVPSLAALKSAIEQMTNQVAGERAGICAAPIYVELAGPRCPELTLVDLPGIVKNPLPGSDQPADIEAKTLELVRLFGASPSAILLAVVPAIIDPATSDAIRAARALDPTGERTLGVLTKLDLLDGTGGSAAPSLRANPFRFGLGVVGTRNRTCADVGAGMSVAEARARERAYFKAHGEYRSLPRSQLGAAALAARLGRTLAERVAAALPAIWRAIDDRAHALGETLDALASPTRGRGRGAAGGGREEGAGARAVVTEKVCAFSTHFTDALLGRASAALTMRASLAAHGGTADAATAGAGAGSAAEAEQRSSVGLAHVLAQFRAFGERVSNYAAGAAPGGAHAAARPAGGAAAAAVSAGGCGWRACEFDVGGAISDEEIAATLAASHGASVPGFDSFDAFQTLITRHHASLRAPALGAVEAISEHLRAQLLPHALRASGLHRYPPLAEAVAEAAREALGEATAAAREAVHCLIDQLGYTYTADERYAAAALAAELEPAHAAPKPRAARGAPGRAPHEPSATAAMGARRVQQLRAKLGAYDALVRAHVADAVPRAIGWHMLSRLQASFQVSLQRAVVDGKDELELDALLTEHEQVAKLKAAASRELAILNEASETLRRMRVPRAVLSAAAPPASAAKGGGGGAAMTATFAALPASFPSVALGGMTASPAAEGARAAAAHGAAPEPAQPRARSRQEARRDGGGADDGGWCGSTLLRATLVAAVAAAAASAAATVVQLTAVYAADASEGAAGEW